MPEKRLINYFESLDTEKTEIRSYVKNGSYWIKIISKFKFNDDF